MGPPFPSSLLGRISPPHHLRAHNPGTHHSCIVALFLLISKINWAPYLFPRHSLYHPAVGKTHSNRNCLRRGALVSTSSRPRSGDPPSVYFSCPKANCLATYSSGQPQPIYNVVGHCLLGSEGVPFMPSYRISPTFMVRLS